jgi:predicted kinase/predicted phosphodiesterase
MRTLLVLRGAPGCGKTTFVKENHLIQYTLSFDNIRMLYRSPIQTIYGKEAFDRRKEPFIFEQMLKILEERMKYGEFTVIDHTNSKTSDLNKYSELALKYRYKFYIIDFTDMDKETINNQNVNRLTRKRIPEHIMNKIYEELDKEVFPKNAIIKKPDELNDIYEKPIDLSKYKKIHHIGDIHGCYEALQKGMKEHPIKDDEFYIFLGDYTDRGKKSAEVLQFMNQLKNKENIVFCEGNHERWVWNWANGIKEYTEEFLKNTKKQIEAANLSKKEIRKLYRTLKECCYYNYHGKTILACHGGIATIPDNLTLLSTHQLIHGVGLYSDLNQITQTFSNQSNIEIFGHRNPERLDAKLSDQVYCLENGVEKDGSLRWLTLDEKSIQVYEYKES